MIGGIGKFVNGIDKPVKRNDWRRWKRVFAAGYFIMAIVSLCNYIDWRSAALLAGILVVVSDPVFATTPTGSFRYGWAALILLLLFILIPVTTILYLAMAAAVLLFRECFHRKAGTSVLLTILLVTPVTDYAVQLFSFPIRLQLTMMAGKIIRITGLPVQAAGNILTCKGREFAVDPACMGLHMLTVSLLAGLLLINYQQTRYRRRLHPVPVVAALALVLGLNILANLFRIVILVLFSILPDNPLHGLIGMAGLAVYVILPMFPLTRWMVRRYGRPMGEIVEGRGFPRSRLLLTGHWLVAAGILTAVIVAFIREREVPAGGIAAGVMNPGIPGYMVTRRDRSILQLSNPRSLVYIKPIPDFYYTDHTPMICWKGSGYVFGQLQQQSIGGVRIYEGVLLKDKQTLYTSWWYDNGQRHTVDQFDWRWDVIRGAAKYSIVNITMTNRDALEEEVRRVLQENRFKKVLGSHSDKYPAN